MLSLHKHRSYKILTIVAGIVVVGLAVSVFVFTKSSQNPAEVAPQAAVTKPIITTKSVDSKMLVMGDVYWGRYINDWSMASPLKYAYPFQKLNEFERDKYDAWIADIECPITNNPKVSSKEEDNYLKFDCSPAYLPEAKKWFTAFTLANNHTDNQGVEGFAETKQHLDENGIQYFGSYDPEDYSNLCNVLSMPVHVTMSDSTVKQGKLPMVWCGYHGVFKIPTAQSVDVISKYSPLFSVVAVPHSGKEYQPGPDEIKTTSYRSMIDAGADVVIGGHPHWVQSAEAYKGKLIVYSVGNFIFDQQTTADVTRGAAISMEVSVDAKEAADIDKWLALGETCGTYADDCLSKAVEQKLAKLPLKYHFSALGSRDHGKVTHLANSAELASIKQRLNWSMAMNGLTGVYSGE